ncbi:MAG: HlyD family efflux transporter periplasmic adaptor subunit [Gammaproteobacteria bacterium]|nr:HlyD family efflux transporter periplasmic adaptor subunit [Gammaproteobacteria bacterium]MCP4882047.1 HlyD family efflux transporter periplasmic adaptor subunit [Gammaproteobacteria bacterium]MDP6165748.1 HlyD family efflux transporter periplasmic adaptor subunit [Gammaproteobacteria bacterium]
MTAKSFFSSLIKKVVLPALIIAAAGYFFVYMKNSKPPVPAEPIAEKAWGVATHVVELVDAAPELALYGAVEASDSVELSATVSAYVDNVNVAKGDTVKAGQSLITLDDRELKLTLAQRQASILDTNARIASEKNSHATSIKAFAVEQKLQDLNLKNLARQEELVDNNMTPASRLEDANKLVHQQQLSLINRQSNLNDHPNRLAQLKAQALQNQAQLEFAEIDLQRTNIVAPFTGRILSVHTAAGNRTRSGDRVISMYNTQTLEVRSQIPARYLPYLQSGQQLRAQLNNNSINMQLPLVRLSAETSNSQGGIDAFFTLPKNASLEVGRNVQLTLALPVEQQVVAIPALALYGQNRVYRVVENRLQAVLVERLGEIRNSEGQPLTLIRGNDLNDDDQLITTQLPNAITGLLVETR